LSVVKCKSALEYKERHYFDSYKKYFTTRTHFLFRTSQITIKDHTFSFLQYINFSSNNLSKYVGGIHLYSIHHTGPMPDKVLVLIQ